MSFSHEAYSPSSVPPQALNSQLIPLTSCPSVTKVGPTSLAQAISYTTGVPAMIGAALVVDKVWDKDGVFNIEEFDPDPFMDMLNQYGLPWVVDEDPQIVE